MTRKAFCRMGQMGAKGGGIGGKMLPAAAKRQKIAINAFCRAKWDVDVN